MTSNYDPKPGRWMLPLVVLAMVAFTYIFVRELPTAATTSTVPPSNGSTSTSTTATTAPDGSTTTSSLPVETQQYLDALSDFETRLTNLQSELGAANTGFDADPRTVSYNQAREAFEQVRDQTAALAGEVEALTPPAGFEDAHAALVTAAQQAVNATEAAVEGLLAPPPDTGDNRRAAVAAFDDAVSAFSTAVDGVRALAAQT
jgi:hypothetical protein